MNGPAVDVVLKRFEAPLSLHFLGADQYAK